MSLSHEQVQRLFDKDVEKYAKRYQAYVDLKTNKGLTDGIIFLGNEAIGKVLPIKDMAVLRQDFKDDFIINHELSKLTSAAAMK